MRRNVLVSVILLLIAQLLNANAAYDVEYFKSPKGTKHLKFVVPNQSVSVIEKAGIQYSVLGFEASVKTVQKGWAELPFVSSTLMLENNNNVDVKIAHTKYYEIQLDAPMLPSRGSIYRNQNPDEIPYVIDPKSVVDAWYPQDIAFLDKPFILRDFRGVSLKIFPFRYNAKKNLLRIYTEIEVEIVENDKLPSVNPLSKQNLTITREMYPVYQRLFINFGDVKDELTMGQYGDILVISTEAYSDAIAPYIEWKKEKGYNVEMEIVAPGTNVSDLVQQKYDDNNNLMYVQLVGDWADIKSDVWQGSAPMDPTLGWVAGNDSYQDVAIGRFSANSAADVTVQVNKTIQYERNPADGDWYKSALGIGSSQGAGSGDDGEVDKDHIQIIYDNKLDLFTYDQHFTSYDPGANVSQVASAVNSGVSIINYSGHGGETSWVTSGFSNSDIANLTNGDQLPFIFSVACVNGAFHSGECFGEAWLKKENGGAIMALMSTINQPWAPPMRGQDYFNDILTGGYDYDAYPNQSGINTSEQRTTIGSIVVNGLVLMYTEASNEEDLKTIETWTLFGDASLEVRTDTPQEITLSNNVLMQGIDYSTTVSVGGTPIEGAMVCLSQGTEYFSGITDASGSVTIPNTLIPGDAKLVVTAFNGNTIYQNITVAPQDGPFVSLTETAFNDIAGNNNGLIDFGEDITISATLKNLGVALADNLTVHISTADTNVTITDDNETCSDLNPGQSITLTDAFAFTVNDNVVDNYIVGFTLSVSNGTDTWESSFYANLHAPVLEYVSYSIDDASGNNNGRLDPGETLAIEVTVKNAGSADITNVQAAISSDNGFVSFITSSADYGALSAGESSSQSFELSIDANTPMGSPVEFTIDISSDYAYSGSGSFDEVIGQIPVLIINLDENNNSAPAIKTAIENNGITVEMTNEIPSDLSIYTSVFLCLGIYSDNHSLSNDEGQIFADYLNAGGSLYMEGGDTWAYDTQTSVHSMFGIFGEEDGTGDMETVVGETDTFTEGMSFAYSGDNNFMDHISATGEAYLILSNSNPVYGTAVANDAETYKTIGASFEFGGLTDGEYPSTKDELVKQYLDFFGLIPSTTVLTAQFVADETIICKMHNVNFTDQSIGDVTSWSWTFEGGEPAYSTEQNPSIYYETPGTYDVTLIVSNATSSDTLTKNDYITVDPCVGVEEVPDVQFAIFPNPTSGLVNIVLDEKADVEIKSLLGNSVMNIAEVEGNLQVDMAEFESGIYFVVIKMNNEWSIRKLILR
jgi:PKD repeat protein